MAGFLCGKTLKTNSMPVNRLNVTGVDGSNSKSLVTVELARELIKKYIQQNPSEVCSLLNNCN